MVEQSVVAVSTKQGAWKDNSVERNVVLGHELVELHFLGVLPPLLPLISIAGSDRQIATDCKYSKCDIPPYIQKSVYVHALQNLALDAPHHHSQQ